jgi:hypothetical protein
VVLLGAKGRACRDAPGKGSKAQTLRSASGETRFSQSLRRPQKGSHSSCFLSFVYSKMPSSFEANFLVASRTLLPQRSSHGWRSWACARRSEGRAHSPRPGRVSRRSAESGDQFFGGETFCLSSTAKSK